MKKITLSPRGMNPPSEIFDCIKIWGKNSISPGGPKTPLLYGKGSGLQKDNLYPKENKRGEKKVGQISLEGFP